MEFVCIEAKTFMEMNEALEAVVKKMCETCGSCVSGMDDWIDNQEACMLMDVSPGKSAMIQSLLTKETPEIIRFFRNIDSLSEMLDKQEEKLRPVLNGERYITDRELAEQLKLTRRTLAEYRINGKLPYYKIGGKLLYKEKDILALLEKNRMEAFDV